MFQPIFPESNDSFLFYVEESSNERNPPRPNTPIVLTSKKMSGNNTRKMMTLSSIVSLRPQIVTIESDSNEPTRPNGFGWQLPFVPPRPNNLYLPPNPFSIMVTVAVANATAEHHDKNYSPESPEPSEPSTLLTHPMNLSTI